MKSETTTVKSKALFSDDRTHRLLLHKEWDKAKPTAMVVMINPNSADTLNYDLTTMLVINNLNQLGYGAVNIVNLYSIITLKLTLLNISNDELVDANLKISEWAKNEPDCCPASNFFKKCLTNLEKSGIMDKKSTYQTT